MNLQVTALQIAGRVRIQSVEIMGEKHEITVDHDVLVRKIQRAISLRLIRVPPSKKFTTRVALNRQEVNQMIDAEMAANRDELERYADRMCAGESPKTCQKIKCVLLKAKLNSMWHARLILYKTVNNW